MMRLIATGVNSSIMDVIDLPREAYGYLSTIGYVHWPANNGGWMRRTTQEMNYMGRMRRMARALFALWMPYDCPYCGRKHGWRAQCKESQKELDTFFQQW